MPRLQARVKFIYITAIILLIFLISLLAPYTTNAFRRPAASPASTLAPLAPTTPGDEGQQPSPEPSPPPETTPVSLHVSDTIIYLPIVTRSFLPASIPVTTAPPQPVIMQQSPANGEEHAPDMPIQMTFDRAMDTTSVEQAFQLTEIVEESPASSLQSATIAGRFEWTNNDRTLHFFPGNTLKRDTTYDLYLPKETPRAVDGTTFTKAYHVRFQTAGFLAVSHVIPADGSHDSARDTAITVIFNRPVVPLTAIGQQGNLPHPLTFEPPIAGRGEWINTSIYTFYPSDKLPINTTYTVKVDEALADATGNPQRDAFTWTFTTVLPPSVRVTSVAPRNASTLVPVDTIINVGFNQPVEPTSIRTAFHLKASDGNDIPGDILVLADRLIFTPTQRLAFDTPYAITIDAGVQSSTDGRPMEQVYRSSFRTVPLPTIIGTNPKDGAIDVSPSTDFEIQFNTPIDPATVLSNISMTPPFSPTQAHTYFSYYNNTFHLSFDIRPTTSYAVHIGPDIADRYGNTTGQTLVVHFRTGEVQPYIALERPGWIATYSADKPTTVRIRSINTDIATLRLYRVDEQYLFTSSYAVPSDATLRRSWQQPIAALPNTETTTRVMLDEQGGPLPPGIYMLELETGQSYRSDRHILVVSNDNLTLKASERTALVWANDLQTGQPVANLALDVYDLYGDLLGSTTTNNDGVAQLALQRTNNRGVVVIARSPFAAASSSSTWSNGILPGDFGVDSTSHVPEMAAHIYTDRPIYRPDQIVSFKGIVRTENDATFGLPPSTGNVQVTITDPTSKDVYNQSLRLNDYATFHGDYTIPEDGRLGAYRITVVAGSTTFRTQFQVAAYRPPEFEVAVLPEQPELIRGTPIQATVAVSYFFGLPVQHVPVEWKVTATDYRFAPVWASRYRFDDGDDPWYCFSCWWMPSVPPTPVAEGQGLTDEQGRLIILLPADLTDSKGTPITRSVRLNIEATATGRDYQAISNRSEIVVHASAVYVGLMSQKYIGTAGDEHTIDLVAATNQGTPLPGQMMLVSIYRQEWHSTYDEETSHWSWEIERTLVATRTTTTDQHGQATIACTPPDSGSYHIVATTDDGTGHQVSASLFLWITGHDSFSWWRGNDDRITLISDRTVYHPGETADIFIPSPFQGKHWTLITIERGGVLSYDVRTIESSSSVYKLPITASHVPNVFVSVVLVSPPTDSGVYGAPVPTDYKVGILPLAVEPDPQSLQIDVVPGVAQAEPGQQVRYDVAVTDADGNPVVAELSLDLVDKAVLSLMPRKLRAIVEAFFGHRPLGVQTASGLAISADRLIEQDDTEEDTDDTTLEPAPTMTVTPVAMATPPAESPPDGGDGDANNDGKRGNESDGTGVREEFADTAYWNAEVTTDAQGKASVQVTLPDNLTTWVMRAVGLTRDTKVGEATAEVVASKPLMIRPVVPRFFVVGDEAELAANVSNRTDQPLTAHAELIATGVTISSPLSQTVQVPAGGEAQVIWQVAVQQVDHVDLVFKATSGSYSDASKPRLATGPEGSLPVYRYDVAVETAGTGGYLSEAGVRTEVIALPPTSYTHTGELIVRLDPSLAVGMRDGLEYLEHFPYECTEQVMSRFLPNVLTWQAMKQLGISDPDLEQRLPGLVQHGLETLSVRQHNDGGWSWWVDQETPSTPHISAYVVFGLMRARQAGFEVSDSMLQRGIAYLERALSDTNTDNGSSSRAWQANEQAWMLYVLAEAGRPDAVRLGQVYEQRQGLSLYARAFLALALHRGDPNDTRIAPLLADLHTAHIASATGVHWEEQAHDWWSMNTDIRSTAIILSAMVQLDPGNALNPSIVRWLMVARTGDAWETTQETAWSLIALTDWLVYSRELQGAYAYAVWLSEPHNNDTQKILANGTVTREMVDTPVFVREKVADGILKGLNWLSIGRGEGPGYLYYTSHVRVPVPVDEATAVNRGMIVQRRYTLADCPDGPKCPDVDEVTIGDRIRVDVTVITPHERYYVVIEDPLPAGAEVIDPGLATTRKGESGDTRYQGMPEWYRYWWWWWRWYDHSEFRDEKVALFADYLHRGSYTYTYTMRATLPGDFRVIPTSAYEVYFPEVFGHSDGQVLRVRR